MGEWRFYAQRAGSGLWLDTDVQLQDVGLDWALSAPGGGEAYIPDGLAADPYASDGRLLWSKWDTLLYGEEDGDLAWIGICIAANPDERGFKLEFISPAGWLHGLPFTDVYRTWKTDAFDVARRLINHSSQYKPGLELFPSNNQSQFTVGDSQPPNFPKKPGRRKGEKKSEYLDSKRYEQWEKDVEEWEKKYGDRERYEILPWEAPMIGDELDSLAKEVGFEWRERVRWVDKGQLKPRIHIDFEDYLVNRRHDIELIDGMNLAEPLDTKDSDDRYANHVIALGAGEGRKMKMVRVGKDDGRLYQAAFSQYKSIRGVKRLRALAQDDLNRFSDVEAEVDNVVAWDIDGFASLSTLRCGDEVKVTSDNTTPPVSTWRRVVEISRNPVESVVSIGLETS